MRITAGVDIQKKECLKELMMIPGVGISIANDLYNIGISKISDLRHRDPDELYSMSNNYAGVMQDRCLLYVFRCAVYFASAKNHDNEKLKWWHWKDF